MADPTGRPEPNRNEDGTNDGKRLKYAFDTNFLSGAHPPDTPSSIDAADHEEDDSVPSQSSDSVVSSDPDSDAESSRLTDLGASFRVFSESMLRMELVELEMLKAREALRFEAEKRRVESEAELTQMLMRTQLQIASFLSRARRNRKRKRSDEGDDDSSTSQRKGAMLLSLLQCSLI